MAAVVHPSRESRTEPSAGSCIDDPKRVASLVPRSQEAAERENSDWRGSRRVSSPGQIKDEAGEASGVAEHCFAREHVEEPRTF